MPDVSRDSREGGIALQIPPPHDFLWRQLETAGLRAIAEKVAAGRPLVLDESIALSHASLPLLGKIVELRPAGSDASNNPAPGALPVERVASRPKLSPCTGQGMTDWESFCQTLITVREEFRPSDIAGFWYPILNAPLDRESPGDGDFTGVDVLRAIALARLILPAEIQIEAPLATLGPKMAQVALGFGASHLGCVAPDGQTSSDPLVADSSLLDELTESCQETTLKGELEKAS